MSDTTPITAEPVYRRIWLIGAFTGIVRWLELLAFGIYALDLTGSAFLVAALALLRFLPLSVLSVFIGALGDHDSPRRLMIWALAGGVAVSAAMLITAASGALTYGLLAAASLASGVVWAFDMPIRRAMIGKLAGPDRIAPAMAYDYVTSHGTRMLGPLAGGLVYQTIGMTGVFAVATAMTLGALILCIRVPEDDARPERAQSGAWLGATLAASREAFTHAVRVQDVRAILAVTVVFNLWGFPFVSMIPVIGREDLGLSAALVGMVASIDGFASTCAIVLIARLMNPGAYRLLYYFGMIGVQISVGAIGLVPGLLPMSVALVFAGLCTAALASMQSTLIYAVAPPDMRSRYLGLMSICIGAGLLGFANIGITASLFGASNALWIVAIEGLIPGAILWRLWPQVRAEWSTLAARLGSTGG